MTCLGVCLNACIAKDLSELVFRANLELIVNIICYLYLCKSYDFPTCVAFILSLKLRSNKF